MNKRTEWIKSPEILSIALNSTITNPSQCYALSMKLKIVTMPTIFVQNMQLDKSNYVFLTDFSRITVEEVANLRHELHKEASEFHVIKNSVLRDAAGERWLPNIDDLLSRQTAIVGGNNPSGVEKVLKKFYKDDNEEKFAIKYCILDNVLLSMNEIFHLSMY